MLDQLIRYRWLNGFICPHCRHDQGYFIGGRLFMHGLHASGIGNGWYDFRGQQIAAFEMVLDCLSDGFRQGRALRLAQQIEVSWITAHRMLRKIRIAMGHRDSFYRLHDLIEIDDALVGGQRSGKRGRSSEGKAPILVTVKNRGEKVGYLTWRRLHR